MVRCKSLRRIFGLLLAVLMVYLLVLPAGQIKTVQAAAVTPYGAHGRLSVSGTKLVDARGQAYQLRGVSTFNLAWYPQYFSKASFQSLRDDWGANAVRLVMYTYEYNGYCMVSPAQQAAYRASLVQCIKDAYDLGMYVILDWHVLNEHDPNTYKAQALVFFREISAAAGGYGNVLYEICNEPNPEPASGGPSWSSVKAYALEVIDVIRANDPQGVVIVGTPSWSQDVDTAAADPINRSNIMYSLHFYANTHRDWYRQKAQTAINAGLALFVTEFGICDASGNGSLNQSEGNTWIGFLDQNNISYCMWQLSNKNESASLLSASCSKTSGWSYSDLSDSGKWYYSILQERRENNAADDYTGLRQLADGSWHYLVGGAEQSSYTGLVLHENVWYYVKNGVVDWSYTGLSYYNGGWFYVKNGALDWSYTGLSYYNGGWFYVKNGALDWSYTGLTYYNGGWFYVKNGVLDWSYTGLTYYNGGWFYVKGGTLDWSYTGLVYYNGSWFYVEKGVLNWSYHGEAEKDGVLYQVTGGVAVLK